MKETITVYTGEVSTSDESADLKSSPLGSCVVVVLFNENNKIGGMAHIMLPGKASEKRNADSGKYAENSIDMLLGKLAAKGVRKDNLKAVVVGGGNVLKRANDTIGTDNLESVNQLLEENKIETVAFSVKGTERKTVRFDIEAGVIYYTKGDDPEKELYQIKKTTLIESEHGKT